MSIGLLGRFLRTAGVHGLARALCAALVWLLAACQAGPVAPTPSPAVGTPSACEPAPVAAAAAHYRFVVDLDYARHTAMVTQTVEVTNNSADAWSHLVLQVAPARYSGAFSLSAATIAGVPVSFELHYASYTYAIALAQPLAPCAATSLVLAYRLQVPIIKPDDTFPRGNLGYGDRVIQFGNWYPALVPYHEGKGWAIWPWIAVGDPWVSEVADYDLEVRAPASIVVAGSGPSGSSSGVWRFHLERARGIAFAASPEYRMLQSATNGVSVYSYFLPDHRRAGADVLTATVQSLALFTRLYGPHPYPSLTIAENAYGSSMEYSGFISHGGAKYAEYKGRPNAGLITIAAHEVAHQWWYGLVGSDQVYEPWLDEALAVYGEVEFYRAYYPDLTDWALSRFGDPRKHGALDRTIYDYPDARTYSDELYDLAGQFAMVMHDGMGADRFHQFLREWRAQGTYRLATAQEFFALYGAHEPRQCVANVAAYFPDLSDAAGGAAVLCAARPASTATGYAVHAGLSWNRSVIPPLDPCAIP